MYIVGTLNFADKNFKHFYECTIRIYSEHYHSVGHGREAIRFLGITH